MLVVGLVEPEESLVDLAEAEMDDGEAVGGDEAAARGFLQLPKDRRRLDAAKAELRNVFGRSSGPARKSRAA